jgi:hypothetical protein
VKKNIPRLAAALFFGRQLPLVRGSLRLRGLLTMQLPQRRLCFIYLALNISLIIIQRLLTSPCAKLRSEQHLETRKQDLSGHALRLLFCTLFGVFTRMRSSNFNGKTTRAAFFQQHEGGCDFFVSEAGCWQAAAQEVGV